LIELKLDQAKVAENDSGGEGGRNRLKCNPVNDHTEERVSKQWREARGDDALSKLRMCASTTQTTSQDSSLIQQPPETTGNEGQLKCNCGNASDRGQAVKYCRHSGQTLNIAEPEPLSTLSERSEPGSNATQVPTKPQKDKQRYTGRSRKPKNHWSFTSIWQAPKTRRTSATL
jgi:hypothetical protein